MGSVNDESAMAREYAETEAENDRLRAALERIDVICQDKDAWAIDVQLVARDALDGRAVTGSEHHPSDDNLRTLWRMHGGTFHGPNVETATIPEDALFTLMRRMLAPSPPASGGLPEYRVMADALREALRHAHVPNMETDSGAPYPFVDLMSDDGDSIRTGEDRIDLFAEHVADALLDVLDRPAVQQFAAPKCGECRDTGIVSGGNGYDDEVCIACDANERRFGELLRGSDTTGERP